MNLLDPVSTIMTKDLITLTPNATVSEVGEIFNNHKIHHVPIVSGDTLVGMVSMSDYLFFSRGFLEDNEEKAEESKRKAESNVKYIMTKGLAVLDPTARINVALEIFKENIFHAIPVIDNDKLVGLVTTYDIISQLNKDNEAHARY